MGFGSRYKRRELGCPPARRAQAAAHTCRTDRNKAGNENARRDKRDGARGAERQEVGEAGLKRARVCLPGGEGLRGHVVHISRASCVSVLIVLLSVTAVWELLKEDRYRWRARPAGLRGAQGGNVLGPQPVASTPSAERAVAASRI